MSKELKGVYHLNPTSMVMKQGSKLEREAQGPVQKKNPRAPVEAPADDDGVEMRELAGHSAMRTRLHHHKHNDGERKVHEDHHAAVRALKGKM